MPSTPQIRVFVTGGTFDKDYDEIAGRLYFHDTHVQEMLRLGRCRIPVSIRTLMMIDSLEMSAADRGLIVENCRSCEESRILVTHGTDTMVETARALADAAVGKTIVLTGAMIPFAFGSSDGLFNLGSALSFAQVLPQGVYVAMNGRCFEWNGVRKNRQNGVLRGTLNEHAALPGLGPAACVRVQMESTRCRRDLEHERSRRAW